MKLFLKVFNIILYKIICKIQLFLSHHISQRRRWQHLLQG